MQSAHQLGAQAPDVLVALGQQTQYIGMISRLH